MVFAIIYLTASVVGFGLTLGFYINGAVESYYDDGYGISISYGDKTLLVLSIVFLFLVIFGVYSLMKVRKHENIPLSVAGLLILAVGLVLFGFDLGWIIKNYDDLSEGLPQYCLLIIGLCSLAGGLVLLFDQPKKSSNQ